MRGKLYEKEMSNYQTHNNLFTNKKYNKKVDLHQEEKKAVMFWKQITKKCLTVVDDENREESFHVINILTEGKFYPFSVLLVYPLLYKEWKRNIKHVFRVLHL